MIGMLSSHLMQSDIIMYGLVGGVRVVRWCWVNFECQGILLIWIRIGQGPAALAVGGGGGCLDIFIPVYHFSFSFSLSFGKRPDID